MAASDEASALRREAHEWVVRLTSGQATVADAEAAKRWCRRSPAHALALAEATRLWETLDPVARQLASQGPRLSEPPARLLRRVGRRALLGGALAASAAAAAGYLVVWPPLELWPSISDFTADYRTGTGERRSVAIDGIAVELNTKSSLNVLPASGTARRLELVSGEAVFAAEGLPSTAPLVVVAGGGHVSAAEAKFDVRCSGMAASVVCLRGTVEVNYGGRITMLHEGQQISYGANGLGSPAAVDAAVATAWREGRLVFHDMPLSKVIDEVNRYRQGRIVLMNAALGRRSIEAILPLDRTDELITLLREAYGVKITTLPGGIVVLT
jgi:transmembrane sensor